jgi:hypothetical protein
MTLSFVRSPKYGEKLKANQVDWIGIILLAAFIGSLYNLFWNMANKMTGLTIS